MAEIRAIFWDIGGVLLTNGWDRDARRQAAARFGLDAEDFETRHLEVAEAFETRGLTLDEYLRQTVFYQPRPFSPAEFRDFMFAQSQPKPDVLRIAEELQNARRHLMAAVNNEELELNLYRIRKFELRKYLSVFFSSCFVRARKPDAAIYLSALEMTQCLPAECIMIDDRPENLEAPRQLGMHTIQYASPTQLRDELVRYGVISRTAGSFECRL